ncbi:preprotein translocase subunit SecA [Buchnera aphidicola (Ceratoglyphina bambusae)]|uniref:preprotein translocase subunit SecA n=1 Tax=Buchnera aphidicola TaxID=9 RepID=UPI0031B803E3
MLIKFIKNLFKNNNEKVLLKIYKTVDKINSLESSFVKLSDSQIKNKTFYYKNRILSGDSLDDILPEAYATVKEASKRIFGISHFNVQIIGGVILHKRCIAEMKTGEGKTLTSTLPLYLNSLTNNGVHIVTMNDYLAKRDYEKNNELFNFLGVSVGLNLPGMNTKIKKNAYHADITYGTNNEFCFDYLRDNMIFNIADKVQRKLNYALIDEVDSILIDEARTPLIVSGSLDSNNFLYKKINNLIFNLSIQEKSDSKDFIGKGDFYIDEKYKQVYLTERGLNKIEKIFIQEKILKKNSSLYSSNNIILFQHVIDALKAHKLFFKNIDYIVRNGEILIIDEHTGRIMEGRRWNDGLHQAIESKENIKVQNESYTLASITFQNYFRLYNSLSGMTGTAMMESEEFRSIYNLETISIPTNKPIIRRDLPDLIYMTEKEKIKAIIKDIKKCIKKKQPVLVGTISIEKSELISKKLKKLNIKHKILNAKFHNKEAKIIENAGFLGSVTIATNMAGRGTDIMLGGSFTNFFKKYRNKYKFLNKMEIYKKWKFQHERVISSGGLHVIGTERHESRRIDDQLRGRSGRQGDIGSSRFYISMEDPLIRIFISKKIINIIKSLNLKKNKPIKNVFVSKSIYNAQKKIENHNFNMRIKLLEYDNIYNTQRLIFYEKRKRILNIRNFKKIVFNIANEVFNSIIKLYFENKFDTYNIKTKYFKKYFRNFFYKNEIIKLCNSSKNKINKKIIFCKMLNCFKKKYKNKLKNNDENEFNKFIKILILKVLDMFWQEYLYNIDHLKKSIHFRGYAEKNPEQEYKKESFMIFFNMIKYIKYEIISLIGVFITKKYSLKNFINIFENFYKD